MTKLAQSIHSLLAFSASTRWIPCPGSMAYPENTADGDGGIYANEGTAAHDLASRVLKSKRNRCEDFIGQTIKAGKDEFVVTEDFADHVQTYVDDVQRRAIGGYLMIEQRVTLAGIEGFDDTNYGTSDAIIAMPARRLPEGSMPAYGVVEDLKFGMGERVYAWTRAQSDDPFTMEYFPVDSDESCQVVPNYQLMMYALAARADVELLVDGISGFYLVINQPRIGNLSELWVPAAVLDRFALFAAEAAAKAMQAVAMSVSAVETHWADWLNPGEKQCRWCRALARCPAAAAKAQKDIGADFEVIAADGAVVSNSPVAISKAFQAIPFIREWIKAVESQANKMVAEGIPVIGADGKPMKFVEGDLGDRKWSDEKAAEAALVGVLGEEAYTKKILSAAAAAKKLDKKKTAQLWKDGFASLVKRAPGKPKLVLGSDPRPAYSGAATSDDFEMATDE